MGLSSSFFFLGNASSMLGTIWSPLKTRELQLTYISLKASGLCKYVCILARKASHNDKQYVQQHLPPRIFLVAFSATALV